MVLKAFPLLFLFALLPASYAQICVGPELGVNGTPTKSDVKRPSGKHPCGHGVSIASSLDTSPTVPIDQNGDVTVTVLDFDEYVFTHIQQLLSVVTVIFFRIVARVGLEKSLPRLIQAEQASISRK